MRQPGLVRDYVIKVMDEALKRVRARLSCSDPFEYEALLLLEGDGKAEKGNYTELLAELATTTMEALGHDTGEPSEPRFNKMRRAARKQVGRSQSNEVEA